MRVRRSLGVPAAIVVILTLAAACTSSGSGGQSGSLGSAGNGDSSSSVPLKIGYILPQTGELATAGLGKAQIDAVKYAVKVINQGGGVNGKTLPAPLGADETGDASTARVNVANLLDNKVDAIIGAAASGMTLAIIDTVVHSGVLECSGSNTTPTLTGYRDNGLYFRTAPSDALQGPVLGNLVVGTGHKKVVVLAADSDVYGLGLQKATIHAIRKAGGTVLAAPTYDPQTSNVDAVVSEIANVQPDGVVLISSGEDAQVIKALIDAGLAPDELFGAGGGPSQDLPGQVDPANPDVLDAMMGTAPAPAVNQTFLQRLKAFDPSLKTGQYAPQVFDCTVVVALAAQEAQSNEPAKIKEHMIDITRGGTECTSFAACKTLLEQGTNIDYNGVSGPLDFDEHGEPASASIRVWKFDKGKLVTVRTVTSTK